VCRYGDWAGGHPQKCKVNDDLDVSVNIRTLGQLRMKWQNASFAGMLVSTNTTPPLMVLINTTI
jgi:hypothetical protein